MIVDFHCHAGQGDGLTGPPFTDAPLHAYLRRARAAGISRTVVVPCFHSDYDQANAGLARIVAKYPGRLTGFAFVHARRDAGRIREMVSRAVRRWGFRGIKVHGADAPATREVCDAAREHRIPILIDVTGRAYLLHMLAPAYPDVSFVVAHMGSFWDDWRAQQQVVDILVRYPNVYADTSGVRRFDYLVEAVRKAGPGKLLFGTDGPWLHPGLELEKIRLLQLPRDQEARITGGNALRLLARRRREPSGGKPRPSVVGYSSTDGARLDYGDDDEKQPTVHDGLHPAPSRPGKGRRPRLPALDG
ncbi:MAG: amidohydrolase family protein [Thermoanaerobaculia bacterium]